MPVNASVCTHRQRLVGALAGSCDGVSSDRAPFAWWLGFQPWSETLARWRMESGLADLDPARALGFEPFFVTVPVNLGPEPHFKPRIIRETAEHIVSVDYRGIVMKNRRDGGSMPDFLEHPIKTVTDWERYKAERLQPQFAARLQAVDAFCTRSDLPDCAIQVGAFPWGIFGTVRDLLGAEELLIAFVDRPELIRDMMHTLVDLWLAVYAEVQARVRIDHLHIWEDMAYNQGPLISPRMIERFMLPEYDRIAAFAREHGIPIVSVDSDGKVEKLVPLLVAHGVNAMFPFEAQAGNDLERFRREYPALGILGGLDKTALTQDRAAIHRELDRCERMLAAGRYIPGFDHLIPPDVPWANYRYACEQIRKLVGV